MINLYHGDDGKEAKLSTGGEPKPVEAQYQCEFYRAFGEVAGPRVPISSEWSRGRRGRVDFFIPEKHWAVELVMEHSCVKEHIECFQPGGPILRMARGNEGRELYHHQLFERCSKRR